MSCKIQRELTEFWSNATSEFSDAIKAMTGDRIATISQTEYMALRAKAEESRLASENARMTLEIHRK
jgi:hypothetical protein